MPPSDKKTLLIAGVGFAGLAAARKLQHDFNVVLCDPKGYFEYTPAAPANMLNASSAARSLLDYRSAGPWTFKQAAVVGIASDGARGEATLQGGERLAFDYALLATGSSYPAGVKAEAAAAGDRAARLQQFTAIREQIEAAQAVVVVGGGSVGVEVASQVAEAFPGKKVTLVCAGALLERLDARAQAFAAQWLEKHGVEVLTQERISDWGGLGDGLPAAATLRTQSGRELRGLVIKCVGARPATATYASSLSAEQLGANGALAVEPTLQVIGWRNVFAAGDVTNTLEEKTAALAGLAARVAAQNILLLDQGKQLQRYPECLFGGPAPPMGGFTLGSRAGVFQMGSDVQAGGAPATIKALFGWMFMRVAAGSRLWGWAYCGMQRAMVKALAGEARKAAAAQAAAQAAQVA